MVRWGFVMKRFLNVFVLGASLFCGGCYVVTPFVLNNGTGASIVLLQMSELDPETRCLKKLSVRKIPSGGWSDKFFDLRPALFIFDEGKNELFAYDLRVAQEAFFEEYSHRKMTRDPIRVVYREDATISVLREGEGSSAAPIFIVTPRKAPELLREKGEGIMQPKCIVELPEPDLRGMNAPVKNGEKGSSSLFKTRYY